MRANKWGRCKLSMIIRERGWNGDMNENPIAVALLMGLGSISEGTGDRVVRLDEQGFDQ
jgi:hypothetical protein